MKRVPLKKLEVEVPDILDEDLKFLTVNINENWRMQYDGIQFQMQERKVRKQEGKSKGEVWWKRHAYISNLDNAIVWLSRKRVYLSPGVFDGRALVEICKTLDAIKAECMVAFTAMKTLILEKAEIKEPESVPSTAPVIEERVTTTKPRKRATRGKEKNS